MSLEERATKLRDKFNYLVKQYKKYDKKKATGNDAFIAEREEIKNLLSLFFKEYGKFIKSRKNSFGTFDYDGYLSHLRKEESQFQKTLTFSKSSSMEDKNYRELYSYHEKEVKYYKAPEKEIKYYKAPNRVEYKRNYPIEQPPFMGGKYPRKHYHTEFIGAYSKKDSSVPSTMPPSPKIHSSISPIPPSPMGHPTIPPPLLNRSPVMNLYNTPGDNLRNSQGGVYEKYLNKKVTVYDFIRDKEVRGAPVEKMNYSQEKNLYRNTTQKGVLNPQILPQVNNIYHSPSRKSPGFIKPVQFSPEYRSYRPLQYGNTPLWKNQFGNMDTSKLQGKVILQHNFVGQPIRTNTYNTVKVKPTERIKKNSQERKKVKIEESSSALLSSSNSDDYQKYFLEDLLKEAGIQSKIPQDTANFLYGFCDNFFEHLLLMSSALSSNAKKKAVCSKDLKSVLKIEFGIELPEESNLNGKVL